MDGKLDERGVSMWNLPDCKIYSQPYRWDQRICTFLFSKDATEQSLFNKMAIDTLGINIKADLQGFCHQVYNSHHLLQMLDNALILKKPQYQVLPKIRLYTWPYVFGIKMRDADKEEANICLLISAVVKKRFPFPEVFMIDQKLLKGESMELVNYNITK
jgi:hypothetical protein